MAEARVMRRALFALIAAVLLIAGASLSAHHGMRDYDEQRIETIDGTLVKIEIRNPHTIVHVDRRDDQGNTEHWAIEWMAELQLKRQGVANQTLHPGDRLVITGYPALNPAEHLLKLRTVLRPSDGWKWTGAFN